MDSPGHGDSAMPDNDVDKEHLLGGLQLLGLLQTSGRSVLHLCSRQLPSGMLTAIGAPSWPRTTSTSRA